MFGKRGINQLYEIGKVVGVNPNGTLDVLINGRSTPYSELPSLIDPRIHREDMVVVVGKAYGNPYMPFVLGDTRGYKKKNPKDFVPVVVDLYDWSSSRSNPKQNFLSGRPGPLINISYGEDGDLIPTQMDLYTQNGVIVGLLSYKVVINEETGVEVEIISAKNAKGAIAAAGYRDEFYAFLPNQFVNDADDLIYESKVTDLYTTSYYNQFNCYVFFPESSKLVLAKRRNLFNTVQSAVTQLIVIDAVSGNIAGGTAALNGDTVTPTAIYTKDFIIDEGFTNCGGVLVKTHHIHDYSHSYAANTTVDNAGNNGKIIAMDISDGTILWSWDPNFAFNGTSLVHLYEVVRSASISDRNATGNPPNTLDNVYMPVNTTANGSLLWPRGVGASVLLPGNPGVYLSDLDIVCLPVVMRKSSNKDTTTWTNPIYSSDTRTVLVDKGPDFARSTVQVNSYVVRLTNVLAFQFLIEALNTPTPLLYGAKNFVDATKFYYAQFAGSSSGYSGPTTSSLLYNYIIALNTDLEPEDRIAWKYEFPVLDARDSDNYMIDTDSFGKVASSDKLSEFTNYYTSMTAAEARYCFNSQSPNDTHSFFITSSNSCLDPCQIYMDSYSQTGYEFGDDVGNYSVTHGIKDTFIDYMYWPNGANYCWDPMFYTVTGNNTQANPGETNTALVADSENNLYGVYLKPKIFVSCADVDHYRDFSLLSRTNPVNPSWNTVMNGYMDDRETVKGDVVNLYGVATTAETRTSNPPYGDGTVTHNIKFYGVPNKYVCYKSFLGKWNSAGALVWTQELTTYMNERIDASPGLDGQIPYPGCTLRIIPTSAGLFVLRCIRLPIATSLREAAMIINTIGITEFSGGGNVTDCNHHTFNSKTVLELRSYEDGEIIWTREIYDPTSTAPAWLCGVAMFGSEESATGGVPWVIGRVDYTRNHSSKTLLIDDPPDYGAGLARTTRVFTCNAEGELVFRNSLDATESFDDFGTTGVWPYDYVNAMSYQNGFTRQFSPVLVNGVISYNGEAVPGDGAVYSYGTGIPPV